MNNYCEKIFVQVCSSSKKDSLHLINWVNKYFKVKLTYNFKATLTYWNNKKQILFYTVYTWIIYKALHFDSFSNKGQYLALLGHCKGQCHSISHKQLSSKCVNSVTKADKNLLSHNLWFHWFLSLCHLNKNRQFEHLIYHTLVIDNNTTKHYS